MSAANYLHVLVPALAGWLLCQTAQAVEPFSLYGREAVYQVERRGQPIGEYRLRFHPGAAGSWTVEVTMQLRLQVLGLFRYDFRYRAEEHWQGPDRLQAMQVMIDDDGDRRAWRFERREQGLYRIDGPAQAQLLGDRLLTSNHWHPGVPGQSRLLNTLTGRVSRLEVERQGEERLQIGPRQLPALRYRLGGDLADTLTWYHPSGRWLGMEFTARDGSRIRLRWQPDQELAERGTP